MEKKKTSVAMALILLQSYVKSKWCYLHALMCRAEICIYSKTNSRPFLAAVSC